MRKNHFAWAMFGMALGIGAGAMGAHSLEKLVSIRYLQVWETAWRYWIYHMLGIMVLVNFVHRDASSLSLEKQFYGKLGVLNVMWLGISIFTGTLVLVSLNELISLKLKMFGAITPSGGLILIFAWIWGAFRLMRHKRTA
jgi:uncharacterized membrane protein YgdD (TMEM256/DUF423 family)